MGITQECDYALRVILFLSEKGMEERVEAKVISETLYIPLRFLLKLLRKLAMAGILYSYRGAHGGYSLAKKPEDISMKDVIEVIDGPIYVNRCLYDKAYCALNQGAICNIHYEMHKIQKQLETDLQKVTFKTMLQNRNRTDTPAPNEIAVELL
ncbi:transcriptional regulator [Anaerocolumna cellulosilytica]|uniref:Transcriptional regulator n=1 Tax=Anaerocolumna cellulosilytica TaxID=433286 RepID=A0A6S6QVX0_9FIRM|nr:Rrf2 family transcriptional regulator [Anaerocolumna cellulosilytica]MBB5197646.1 Rrf2 family protein [Anaerocolumna cellulosilytica]BCJ93219.1 transcriptional regulator [Anaerocolumna cellulosilytica]